MKVNPKAIRELRGNAIACRFAACVRLKGSRMLALGWLAFSPPSGGAADVQVFSREGVVAAFGGVPRQIEVQITSRARDTIEVDLGQRLVQATSATVAPLGPATTWKRFHLRPGQTLLESHAVTFPTVRAVTRFGILWQDNLGQHLGTTEVDVHPAELLRELGRLAGPDPIGVLDPDNSLKPLLRSAQVALIDLEARDLNSFGGSLAILGPFRSAVRMPRDLRMHVLHRAKAGLATVWFVPARPAGQDEEPRHYLFEAGHGSVFVAASDTVAGLSENPRAQRNLVRFARLALRLEQLDLPKLNP